MKIIHTADIHLDSPLAQVKDSATRRYELLRALSDLSEYARNNDVQAIIVAGDLFDNQYASDATVASVAEIIERSRAEWFVLKGNHAGDVPYVKLKAQVPRIKTFENDWTYHTLGNVTFCGREAASGDGQNAPLLDKGGYNVVILHGDVDDDRYGAVDLKALAKCNADYVALGHRHAFARFKLGSTTACYSGALEPRGFDEPSRTGFVLIDTDSGEIAFVERHIRRIQTINVDVTNVSNDVALSSSLSDAAAEVDGRNYLNVVFCGALQDGVHLNTVARSVLENRFFALRIDDQTTTAYDLASIAGETSLRGEFVKLANRIEDEKLRNEVIKIGLQALSGEEIA